MTAAFDNEGFGDLVPDRIPDWLIDMVNRSKGRNMDDYSMLDQFYKETQTDPRRPVRRVRTTARCANRPTS